MNFMKTTFVLVSIFFSSTAAFGQDASCASLSANQFRSDVISNNPLECAVNPDLVKIRVYKVALCKNLPTLSDTSSCEFVYNAPSGRIVSISSGTSAPLAGVFELSYDSYPYVLVEIDNAIAFKSTFSLPDPVGVMTTSLQPNLAGGFGSTCWTNGNDAKQDHTNDAQPVNIECGNSSNAQISTELFYSFTDQMVPSVSGVSGVGGDTFDINLISASGALATITNDGNNILTSSDADRMVLIQHSAVPLVINDSTTNIDLGFATTDRMNVQFFPCTISSSPDECAAYGFTTGFQIHVTAQ